MALSDRLITLGKYLAGEFDNQQQALAQPAWFVHLRLWMRPVPIFTEDSITLFAEQANTVKLDQPYRSRIIRLRQRENIEVEYYMFKNFTAFAGASQNDDLLHQITSEQIQFLPDCTLKVAVDRLNDNRYSFQTSPIKNTPCSFNYQGNTYQVFVGFETNGEQLQTYDKGIDPATGKATWGAILDSYRFTKRRDFASELFV
ncbi:chromophore lyase CpcT/CpeT [Myxosarcina sp. GI1]|uniref:chromophore lyase CpcT/CpeT n=1 Tax=Myxosarcina sp. GI1 TaxID=1541065 RepID=UPI000564A979|nr:chromophore lyase CpcT/CpeT [Myxosarcina sp. GI1]